MASLFWTIATSDLVLWIDAAILIAAGIVGWAPLLRWFPLIGAYVPLARAVFVVVLFVFGVCIGHRLADESVELARVKTDLAFSRLQLDVQKQSSETAARLREEAETSAATAIDKVRDYEAVLAKQPHDDNCTLTDDDLRRLRAIAH